jgi:hypothetical protein
MYYLNLPKIPESLVTEIKLESNLYGKETDVKTSNLHIKENLETGKKIIDLYSEYFEEKIEPVMLIIRNNYKTMGNISAHFDIERKTAVNYIIDTGEKNVKTVFYNKFRDDEEYKKNSLNKNFDSKDLIIDKSYVIETNKWHCFNAQQAHGVQNIEVYRIVVCILLESNINFVDFIKKYNKYILNKV